MGKHFIVKNILWNLKVSAAQTKLVELEALCNYLGVSTVKIGEVDVSIKELVFDMYVRLRGRRKA